MKRVLQAVPTALGVTLMGLTYASLPLLPVPTILWGSSHGEIHFLPAAGWTYGIAAAVLFLVGLREGLKPKRTPVYGGAATYWPNPHRLYTTEWYAHEAMNDRRRAESEARNRD